MLVVEGAHTRGSSETGPRRRRGAARLLVALVLLAICRPGTTEEIASLARGFFPEATRVGELEGSPPAAAVLRGDELLGYVFLTDEVAPIPAYSGKPVSALVGLDVEGRITGVEIVAHQEPILVVGVTEENLRSYVSQYRGENAIDKKFKIGGQDRPGHVTLDGISGATITVMVVNASVTRAARMVAASRDIPLSESEARAATSADGTAAQAGRRAPDLDEEPMWKDHWRTHRVRIGILGAGLLLLTCMLFVQDWLTWHPRLLAYLRIGFLVYTLVFIGWYALAQLSVVNVLTFMSAIMAGFRWETFLIEPLIFILWSFVAITILLWGRGVFCGWLCPYGALQELVNKAAQRLGTPQLPIPPLVHERLLAIKYVVLVALFGLSMHSMAEAVRYAEVEPFKTAITLRFQREWHFVAYAAGLVLISAVNTKFFCKYLCPLGAALAIPSHFRIFDWLRRRKECGRPCQICANECPSQAIRPTGEIDLNECHHCLDCQVTYWNAYKCPPLVERRKRFERRGQEFKPRV